MVSWYHVAHDMPRRIWPRKCLRYLENLCASRIRYQLELD
jgi:hypothetical protein